VSSDFPCSGPNISNLEIFIVDVVQLYSRFLSAYRTRTVSSEGGRDHARVFLRLPAALPPGEAGDFDSILLRLVNAGRTREPWPLPAADADGFGDGTLPLLRSLLQPDPKDWLSFDNLFAHPCVTAAPAPASGSRASAAPSAVAWQSQTSGKSVAARSFSGEFERGRAGAAS